MSTRPQRRRSTNDRGFTLVELLIVMVIIGILAAITTPALLGQRRKVTESGMRFDLKTAATYMETYAIDYGTYVGAARARLKTYGFRESAGNTVTIVSTSATRYCLRENNADPRLGPFFLDSADGAVTRTVCS